MGTLLLTFRLDYLVRRDKLLRLLQRLLTEGWTRDPASDLVAVGYHAGTFTGPWDLVVRS